MKNPFKISGLTKLTMVIGYCLLVFGLTACTETWDDHYDTTGSGVRHEGSLWQAIKANPELSNFASVLEAASFDRTLSGTQMFTVFAPTNAQFSSQQAQELIAQYKREKMNGTIETDNTVVKEFIQNHMALYNYSVSSVSNDSVVLMNGKVTVLQADNIGGSPLLTKNNLYDNGVLFTVGKEVSYLSNVFEYLRKDPELDSVRSFLYCGDSLMSGRSYPQLYWKEFMPSLSVPGSIVDGKTVYLDSVFMQRNRLFSSLGNLNIEDSTYILVAPTNEVWKELVEEYEPYFNYAPSLDKRDSLVYLKTRMAIMEGTTFSRTYNSDKALMDSARSENCVKEYALRRSSWGAPFEYYQYFKPLSPNGALDQDEVIKCSNGEVRKARKWNIDKQMTFHQYHVIEAENSNNIKTVKREKASGNSTDSVDLVTIDRRIVSSENPRFYNKVWSNIYIEAAPTVNVNPSVTFFLKNVLSNIGYDIYVVTAPALANGEGVATEEERLPTKLRVSITQPGRDPEKERIQVKDTVTTPDMVEYLLVAENFKFDRCTYGINTPDMQALLEVETRVSSTDLRKKSHTRTMRIDCILMVPHGSLWLVDALPVDPSIPEEIQGTPGIIMLPHGYFTDRPFKWWYSQR